MDAERHRAAPIEAAPVTRRRRSDRLRRKDLVYLVGLLLVAASLWVAIRSDGEAARADRHAGTALARIQEGRATSLSVTCAVLSAISDQGRQVITGSSLQDTPFTRALERLGYPPVKARRQTAVAAGAAYVAGISGRVDRELAQRGKRPIGGLVRRDGTIDCRVLQAIADVPNPR